MRRFGHSWPRVPETKVGRFGAGGQPLSSGPAHRCCGLSPDVWPKRTDCFWASNSSSVKALSRRNRDLGFLHTEEELTLFLEGEIPPTVEEGAHSCGTDVLGYVSEGPGLSVYALSDGSVYRTYVTTARGLEPAMAYYGLLDRTPKGRDESATEPLWVRRHDEYETS